ncbi:MAG: hypothetical protein KDJ98_14770 [Rhodobacteraceae bacterium]|nr:hypothetical protein [Paracoccaceae bacterium]
MFLPDQPSLLLTLSGSFRARDARDQSLLGLSRRGQGLLAYLATAPGMRAERGRLADLLWSDRAEAQARASLRQELSLLRRTLPDGVLGADRQSVWLNPGQVRLDARGGIFLDGFDLPSEGFEDWLRQERSSAYDATEIPRPLQNHDRPSLAVLPFEELGARDSDMFADGVVEEITGALSRVHEFHVIARQSAFALRGERLGMLEVAARLRADYVVAGSVRRSGDRVRIAVQLISGSTGHALWSERFDDRIDDLFDLQDRIAAKVAGQVAPNLRFAEIARTRNKPPKDRSAYEMMLSALPHFWSHTREGNLKALEWLEKASAANPEFGPALALRAWCLSQEHAYMYSKDPARALERALEAIERAARHVGDHAPSLTALAASISMSTTDLDRANHYIDRALSLDPNSAWAWMRRGWARAYVGDAASTLAAVSRAEALSPLDPFRFNMILARAAAHYHWMRDDTATASGGAQEAVRLIHEAMRLNPKAIWINRMLASACYYAGDSRGSHDASRKLLEAYPHLTIRYLKEALPKAAFVDEDFGCLVEAGIPHG